ncbi:MAG: TRAP transporter large permease subunit [Rhodospirillales bacterium]|nr:TRAP transporter large permease subunit [Rhodospirillales bacterium]
MELVFLILLVVIMVTALGSGFPVAFALPGSAIITIGLAAGTGYLFAGDASAYFAQGGPIQWLSAGVTNFRGVYWEVERDTLIAIPLFVFMGIMLQRSKIAEDLLVTMAQLFGPVPGGLGISVVFVGALLAATTGIVGATVVAMGLISLPAMLRSNYSKSLATGTIAASGTLGQIIPPSIVLIILADQLTSAVDQAGTARKALYKAATGEFSMPSEFAVVSTSAGDMFLGAFIPGILLVILYMVYIQAIALFRPKLAPAVPFDGALDRKFLGRVLLVLVPPLALIFVVLGSIIMGVATVNQAGAIGAAGAMMMAGYRLREGHRRQYVPAIMAIVSMVAILVITSYFDTNIKNIKTTDDVVGVVLAVIAVGVLIAALIWSGWRTYKIENTLTGVMVETAKTTSLVFIILLGAAMLTAAFRGFGGEDLVREFLTGLPGGFWAQFAIVMAVIFVLGFFLDFIEIAVVVVPIVAPILLMDPSANVTAVWLGVMIGLNIQTSFLTPPFGFALFYLRGVAPAIVRTVEMYKGVIAFICLQLVALFIVAMYPPLVNYLPSRVSLTADTAPPPINPRLQYCIEQITFADLATQGDALRAEISRTSALDYSYLPSKLRKAAEGSFKDAGSVFAMRDMVLKTEADLDAITDAYRPLHREVRSIEKKIRKIEADLKQLGIDTSRLETADQITKDLNDAETSRLIIEREQLVKALPANWKSENAKFVKLQKLNDKARKDYRSAMDGGYQPIIELLGTIQGTADLARLKGSVEGLAEVVSSQPPEDAADRISDVSKELGDIEGTSSIKSGLTKVRRAASGRTPDPEKAMVELEKTITLLDKELVWRQKAVSGLLPQLTVYEAAIRETIGLRQLSKLPQQQALKVASCNASHRDISLHF